MADIGELKQTLLEAICDNDWFNGFLECGGCPSKKDIYELSDEKFISLYMYEWLMQHDRASSMAEAVTQFQSECLHKYNIAKQADDDQMAKVYKAAINLSEELYCMLYDEEFSHNG